MQRSNTKTAARCDEVGPTIWAVISTIFFDLLRDKGHGFKMETPLSKLALHMMGFGFVDDTDIMQLGLNDNNYQVVPSKLQEALKWCEACTKISGVLWYLQRAGMAQ